MRHRDKIEILWLDSMGDDTTWQIEKDFDFEAHDKYMYHKSIGYFLKKTNIATYICQSSQREMDDNNQISYIMAIPNRAILDIQILKSVESQ